MKHLYGVLKGSNELKAGPFGMEKGKVQFIPYNPYNCLMAAVKDREAVSFDLLPREELLRELQAHQSVLEEIAKVTTVIPLRFGMFAEDENEVLEILQAGYPQFQKKIEEMAGKTELECVVSWHDLKDIFAEISAKYEIKTLKDSIASRPFNDRVEETLRIGQMVHVLLDEKRKQLAEQFLDELKGYCLSFCLHDLANDSMILNAAFLLEKANEQLFDARIQRLDQVFEGKLDFKVVGPLPLHSFSTFEVKRITPYEIREAREVLKLSEEETKGALEAAYRKLVSKAHPDKNHLDPEAERKFKAIEQAYKILSVCCTNGKLPLGTMSKDVFVVKPLKHVEVGWDETVNLHSGDSHRG